MKLTSLPFKSMVQAFACLTMVFTLVGCNKTEDFENIDQLIQKDWHLTSRTAGGNEISEVCDLDDVLRFVNTSEYSYNLGPNTCEVGNLVQTPVSWKLTDDFTVIRMKTTFRNGTSAGSGIEYWEITELNDSTLVLKDANAEDNDIVPEFRTYK